MLKDFFVEAEGFLRVEFKFFVEETVGVPEGVVGGDFHSFLEEEGLLEPEVPEVFVLEVDLSK